MDKLLKMEKYQLLHNSLYWCSMIGIFVMGFRPFYILKSGRGLCRLEIKGEFVALTACKIKVGLKFLF